MRLLRALKRINTFVITIAVSRRNFLYSAPLVPQEKFITSKLLYIHLLFMFICKS